VLAFTNTGPAEQAIRRAQAVLDMGLDDSLLLEPPGPREDSIFEESWNPRVRCRTSLEPAEEAKDGPVITKEYRTPDGLLEHKVRITEDWPFGGELPLCSDFNVSGSAEFLVKSASDLRPVKHLFVDPSRDQLARFREEARKLRRFAAERDLLLEGGWIALVDMAVWLCGIEPLIWKAVEDAAFVEELLQIVYSSEKTRIELLLDEGVDVVTHSAWYEMPQLWSPELYRRLIKPVLRREIELCHSGGAHFCYILTSGSSLIADDLLEMGVDSLRGLDPVQGLEQDLAAMKARIGGRVTLWGGVNTAVTLNSGTGEQIRTAVREAIQTLAPGGGFVLHPVDSIFSDTPEASLKALIESWREYREYS
jgi:hypothetical protein